MEVVRHLYAALLRDYVDKGIPVHAGTAWPYDDMGGRCFTIERMNNRVNLRSVRLVGRVYIRMKNNK